MSREEQQRREERVRRFDGNRFRPTGHPPYGGTGVRRYSTSAPVARNVDPSSASVWCERALERTQAAKYAQHDHVQYLRAVNKATALHRYWSRFPPDATIQSLVPSVLGQLKLRGTLYVAMTIDRKLLFGVTAPYHTFKGTANVANHFKAETVPFVKVDLKRFRKMKQRGEIITGGPYLRGSLGSETSRDWTGSPW